METLANGELLDFILTMGYIAGQDASNSALHHKLPSREEQPLPASFLGDGARLVQTEHIHTSQGLNRVHLLHQDLFKPNLITAVKSEVMVKGQFPLGNIPRRAVDEFTTDDLRGKPFKSKASSKRARPKGMIIFPVKPASLSKDFMDTGVD